MDFNAMINELMGDYPAKINDQITFVGVLQKFLKPIRRGWCDTTTRNYLRDYNRHIVQFFLDQPINTYSLEYCEKVIYEIKAKNNFSTATERHYRLLIERVFEQANLAGVIEDDFWGSDFKKYKPKALIDKIRDGEKNTVRFFTVSQEYEICEIIFTNPKQDARAMGLLIMDITGARNAEACAICFEDVVIKEGKPYICIINSIEEITAISKAGTKTKNGYRYFPISWEVYDFLMARKAWLQELIDNGTIKFPENSSIKSVEQMSISCEGPDWFTYLRPSDLTKAGRKLFKQIKITEDQMREIENDMNENISDPVFGNYRDASAYAFRRCVMNHCMDTQLTKIQCRYVAGHSLEMKNILRSFFANGDQLSDLAKKLANRPLFYEINYDGFEINVEANEVEKTALNLHDIHGLICTEAREGETVVIRIVPCEPHTNTSVTFMNESDQFKISGTYRQKRVIGINREISNFTSRSVNILYDYWRPYAEEAKRRKPKKDEE